MPAWRGVGWRGTAGLGRAMGTVPDARYGLVFPRRSERPNLRSDERTSGGEVRGSWPVGEHARDLRQPIIGSMTANRAQSSFSDRVAERPGRTERLLLALLDGFAPIGAYTGLLAVACYIALPTVGCGSVHFLCKAVEKTPVRPPSGAATADRR